MASYTTYYSKLILQLSVVFVSGILHQTTYGQKGKTKPTSPNPKLIIGIVVDQMRFDYLYRYSSKYSNGGFKRLMNEGFNEKNTLYPYIPTATGPGHACIFTGSVPGLDGIIDNDWYSRKLKKNIYCVSDSEVTTVGSLSKAGKMSPRNLLVTTLSDQLKLSNNFQSKVIGIAQKDRASILPVGHSANAAYWLDAETGNFISSSYYLKELPEWVNRFNQLGMVQEYLSKDWSPFLPIETYTESDPDQEPYETQFPGETSSCFPHRLAAIPRKDFDLIRSTPFGNDLTKDFAISALKNEKLGKSNYTDFLSISFSSTDYVGHAFGPNSIEVEDTYLRLDKNIEQILTFLDQFLGKEQVLVFLTADHGVAPTSGFNLQHKFPAGSISGMSLIQNLKDFTKTAFGNSEIIEQFSNDQIYLNYDILNHLGLKEEFVFEKLRTYLLGQEGVANLVDLNRMYANNIINDQLARIQNGYSAIRSGDFQILLEPYWMFGRNQGTNHGTGYHYDTHVPLLWYGWKIKHGESSVETSVTDIASTIADWMNIETPNGSIGKILNIPFN